jgi:hypothetical protein
MHHPRDASLKEIFLAFYKIVYKLLLVAKRNPEEK